MIVHHLSAAFPLYLAKEAVITLGDRRSDHRFVTFESFIDVDIFSHSISS